MPVVARYLLERDAVERAAGAEQLYVERRASERWPEYPWTVARDLAGLAGELDAWAERWLEGTARGRPGASSCARAGTAG